MLLDSQEMGSKIDSLEKAILPVPSATNLTSHNNIIYSNSLKKITDRKKSCYDVNNF